LPVGRGTAVFCYGHLFHRRLAVKRLEIEVDGRRHPVSAARMPRLDVVGALHPALRPEQLAAAEPDPDSPEDPELRSYRSGFWATVPIEGRDAPGSIALSARARLADGSEASAELGVIEVVDPAPAPTYELPGAGGPIAICMATYEPDAELFRAQVESLRAQTETNWVCLISDDCSTDERFEAIVDAVGDDPRFVVSRSTRNRGFYLNFERALRMVPAESELVALCDQDDRWYPDKLAVLRDAIGTAELVYSDQRLVDPAGRVLRDTFWEGRRNNHTNLASLVIANTIVGAASLFHRRLLDVALPFPEGVGWEFHDHWLGMAALATGEIAYVDRPLYDYVQHPDAVLGKVSGVAGDRPWWRPDPRRIRGAFGRWRAAYFLGYLPLEVQVEALVVRCGRRLTGRKRRTLRRYLAASRSPLAFAWLAGRPLRELLGHNETLGTESVLARGILWRHLLPLRIRGRAKPRGAAYDASLPSPYSFEQRRLRRWQARIIAEAVAGAPAPPRGREGS
jgi:glycosyltransferase involved in cell wall biosynthesis